MTYKELYYLGVDALEEASKEIEIAKIVLAFILNKPQNQIYLYFEDEVDQEKVEKFLDIIYEYVDYSDPIQYILGQTYFYGRKFLINDAVLIPRPETETLVDIVIKKLPSRLKVLEIGTGSGIIGITLNKEKDHQVLAIDLSEQALEVAIANAELNEADIEFRQSITYSEVKPGEVFDLIVSNPPYLSPEYIIAQYVEFEPEIALYGGDEGLDIIKEILMDADKYLTPNGMIILEHNPEQAFKIMMLSKKYVKNSHAYLLKDLAGRKRITLIRKVNEKWKMETLLYFQLTQFMD